MESDNLDTANALRMAELSLTALDHAGPDGPARAMPSASIVIDWTTLTGEQWADEADYRPVTRTQLQSTGAAYVMLGHFHDGRGDGFLCYPGSPEPLDWGERSGGQAQAGAEVVVTVKDSGTGIPPYLTAAAAASSSVATAASPFLILPSLPSIRVRRLVHDERPAAGGAATPAPPLRAGRVASSACRPCCSTRSTNAASTATLLWH